MVNQIIRFGLRVTIMNRIRSPNLDIPDLGYYQAESQNPKFLILAHERSLILQNLDALAFVWVVKIIRELDPRMNE